MRIKIAFTLSNNENLEDDRYEFHQVFVHCSVFVFLDHIHLFGLVFNNVYTYLC